MIKKINIFSILLSVIVTSCLPLTVIADITEIPEIPEPVKVIDFCNSFEALATIDEEFEVVDNAAKPELVMDEEMGQVLKLGKAVIKNQECQIEYEYSTGAYSETRHINTNPLIISDDSEYSTIKISNPYVGLEYLKEYEYPFEDVKTKEYRNLTIPDWQEGITITYWIKSPAGENGIGLNSNVLGFTSERFQLQSNDYAYHLNTVKYDIDFNKYTDEEKAMFGELVQTAGVMPDSDFYFEYASDELYNGYPVYKNPSSERMGVAYWMNKNFTNGYLMNTDGTIGSMTSYKGYDYYKEAPYLGDNENDHNPNNSNLRYAWTYSEMWLDASSSFYFTNDEEVNFQLNPNLDSYGTVMGMNVGNRFNINSWKYYYDVEKAVRNGAEAKSPITEPDKWHYVTVIIQNDWVRYYIDGEEIDVESEYSSFGQNGLPILGVPQSKQIWKYFNKGMGARGYGSARNQLRPSYYPEYCSPTIMEWITMDCVNLTIGGGNRNGDAYCMFADTDEIYIKNIVFYDKMLNDEQIKVLAEIPDFYSNHIKYTTADVNNDGDITARDALLLLKHSAKVYNIEEAYKHDINYDKAVNAEDAIIILKYAAGIIDSI